MRTCLPQGANNLVGDSDNKKISDTPAASQGQGQKRQGRSKEGPGEGSSEARGQASWRSHFNKEVFVFLK